MYQKTTFVANKAGIHCRPSAILYNAFSPYQNDNELYLGRKNDKTKVNGILDIIALGLQCGEEVTITGTGNQEKEIVEKIAELLETHFDFK